MRKTAASRAPAWGGAFESRRLSYRSLFGAGGPFAPHRRGARRANPGFRFALRGAFGRAPSLRSGARAARAGARRPRSAHGLSQNLAFADGLASAWARGPLRETALCALSPTSGYSLLHGESDFGSLCTVDWAAPVVSGGALGGHGVRPRTYGRCTGRCGGPHAPCELRALLRASLCALGPIVPLTCARTCLERRSLRSIRGAMRLHRARRTALFNPMPSSSARAPHVDLHARADSF